MKIIEIIKKYINDPQYDCFSCSVDKQKNILNSFMTPKDNIDRSYYQYKCQMKLAGNRYWIRSNVISFFIFWGMVLLTPGAKKNRIESPMTAVFVSSNDNRSCIPESLTKEFKTIEDHQKGFKLSRKDRRFIMKLFLKYPFSYFFLAKTLIKIGDYRNQIVCFSPKAIITSSEYSFTSSVLTEFCHQNGLEHINVMHGEKLFFIRDSFYCFDRCYIWDDIYAELGKKLRADEAQFIVERSPSQQQWKSSLITKCIDYTYYLQAEKKEELIKIRSCLLLLKDKGKSIAVRPHPLYSDNKLIRELFSEFEIEDKDKVNIKESVLRTRNAISLYSSVLSQALNNDVPIIIDDVSNPEKFHLLSDLAYSCLHKPHRQLSEIL